MKAKEDKSTVRAKQNGRPRAMSQNNRNFARCSYKRLSRKAQPQESALGLVSVHVHLKRGLPGPRRVVNPFRFESPGTEAVAWHRLASMAAEVANYTPLGSTGGGRAPLLGAVSSG